MAKNPHPSGRPIRRQKQVDRRYYNVPLDEPLTPRLRLKSPAHPIGFTVGRLPGSDDEDE